MGDHLVSDVFGYCVGHRSFDETGCDTVRCNAKLSQLKRPHLYHADDGRFGGNIICLAVVSANRDVEEAETIRLGNREVNSRAYVARFNFSGSDQQKQLNVLSGGERNRVHLAVTLKNAGNVLLLDEPTNDLDVNTLRALEVALEHFAGCAVIISHDRWFLDRIATHIMAFEGNGQVIWFEGNYSDYGEDKRKRLGSGADKGDGFRPKSFTRG